ncbi:sensor histidine kinase [Aestuariibius sp. 2305UL40-4]|uniref:sensor histidine kinase n=1 Tax=Aestuariibius violaceus TaxID=3234132 RepID=UPI00345EA604
MSLKNGPAGRIRVKWRPSLGLVVGGTLLIVLGLPFAGLFAARLFDPPMTWPKAWAVLGTVTAVTAILGFLLWRLLVRPIRDLAAKAAEIEAGGPVTPLDHYGTSELRDLGAAVLRMGEVLQNREATIRAYTDHVTHELKSPLTAVAGAAELLEGDPGPTTRTRLAARIGEAADRMTRLVEAQRDWARATEAARGTATLSQATAGLALPIDVTQDGTVPLSPEALHVVLLHLARNAAEAGATRLQATATEDGLSVTDDGPGISNGNRGRIFDPYFTTRRDSGGTGMGLAILRRLIEAQGGRIDHHPTDKGARFDVTF